MTTHFLVHDLTDTVGVVVVEDVAAGAVLSGWMMATDETITIEARDAIPLGHKIALKPLSDGDTVLKYGHDIGRMVAGVEPGGHVHVHNMKTKRW